MVQKVKAFLEQWHMLDKNDTIVIGVSGGADSVCLLELLFHLQEEFKLYLAVVHVNHGLRVEAKEEADYVRSLCEEKQIPFYLKEVNVKQIARDHHLSEEEAGRKVRYETFSQVLEQLGGGKIAVAHTQNDLAETTLFHLFRGTGISGAAGIPPVRDNIIRPLLCLSRREIEAYLRERNITFVTDQSNLTDQYSRNKIRHHILGYAAQELNSDSISHVADFAMEAGTVYDFLEEESKKALAGCSKKEETRRIFEKEKFFAFHTVLQKQMLFLTLEEFVLHGKDLEAVHVLSILSLLTKQGEKRIDLPNNLEAVVQYDRFWIGKKEQSYSKEETYTIPIPGILPQFPLGMLETSILERKKEFSIPEKKYTKWLDYDKIKCCPVLRKRQEGDYLCINAQNQKQSLKKYMIQEKIPASERDQIWVLADDSHILWVLGHRISNFYKVTETTKQILKLEIRRNTEDE